MKIKHGSSWEKCLGSSRVVSSEARPPGHICGLASSQRWYARIYDGALRRHAVVSFTKEMPVGVDIERLRNALCGIIGRHDVLRTAFVEWNGELVQYVAEPENLIDDNEYRHALMVRVLTEVTVSGGIAEARATATQLAEKLSSSGISVSEMPLIRVIAVRWKSGHGQPLVLAIVAHHLIFDGPSIQALLSELLALVDRPAKSLAPTSSY